MLVFAISGCGGEPKSTTPPPKPVRVENANNLRLLISREIAAGNKRIVIPPGRYTVEAFRGTHLGFSNINDVEIIAEGVELVCTSTVRAVSFEECTNVTLRGLKIDYDPLPFTQGKITTMAPDKSWLEFEVAGGYPEDELAEPFQIYDPNTGSLRRGDARWQETVQPLGNRRYRVSKGHGYRFDPAEDTEQTGDILVGKNFSGGPGSPHAIELRECKGVRLEDITLHASPSFGFLERNCEATTYLRCVIDRRAPSDDPVARDLPRLRSLNADAFHSKDATVGPAILSCRARYQGDDAVNINGRFHFVRAGNGREMRIAIIDRQNTLRAGDPVEFLPFSGPRPPDAKVVRRQPDPEPFTEKEKSFIRRLPLDARMKADLLGDKVIFHKVVLDREISLPLGTLVACSSRLGHGFSVKDCDFGETRSRGILIKASNGEVSGNRISNTRMHAILISPEFWWMEAGMSSNVVVKDNIIKGSLESPIRIRAHGGDRQILPAGALRDLSILNNRMEDCAWPLIHATSTTGLVMDGNVLPATPPRGTRDQTVKPILLEECETK